MGQPCIEAFFGGSLARELQARGELADFAIEELINLFGSNSATGLACWPVRSGHATACRAVPIPTRIRVMPAIEVAWQNRPMNRIFFAGEATSQRFFSTAHGAYQSGRRAAM